MKFLRLSSVHVRQIVILHCHDDDANEVLAGRNFTVLGAPHARLVQSRVLANDCLVSHTVYTSVRLCLYQWIPYVGLTVHTHTLLAVPQGCHFNVSDVLSVALCSS